MMRMSPPVQEMRKATGDWLTESAAELVSEQARFLRTVAARILSPPWAPISS
jgi:hypothetical protein